MNEERQRISVIVPVYNVEPYLAECLESILAQTYENLEIVLVDDGSTDNGGGICDEYEKKDKRIRVIHKANGGLSEARNVGIENSTGEWIVFVDSDDVIHKDMIRVLYETAREKKVRMVLCDFVETDESGNPDAYRDTAVTKDESYKTDRWEEVSVHSAKETEELFYRMGTVSFCMVAWNKIYHRELFASGIRYPKGKIFEDGFTTYRYIYEAGDCAWVFLPLYYYRQRKNSIMKKNGNRNYLPVLESAAQRQDFYLEKGEKDLYLLELNKGMRSAIEFYERCEEKEGRRIIKEWFRRVYRERFVKEKWPLGKKIRMRSFITGYGLYKVISSFEKAYNVIRK